MTSAAPGARREGLPAAARVRERSEFLACQRAGLKHHTRHFVIFGGARAPTESAGRPGVRLGITASRQVGNAVRRNRWKRLVREAFRRLRGAYPESSLNVVVIARRDVEPPSQDVTMQELSGALARLHKLKAG